MKPILFNTEMVKAILDGRKTVTRRIADINPDITCNDGTTDHDFVLDNFAGGKATGFVCRKCGFGVAPPHSRVPCGTSFFRPRYWPGDILYIRETWSFWPCFDCDNEMCYGRGISYKETDGCFVYKTQKSKVPYEEKWRPSIHMPKEAARIFILIKSVRLERLHSMTENDALAEGIPSEWPMEPVYCPECKGEGLIGALHPGTLGYMEVDCPHCEKAVVRFAHLWDSTIKPADLPFYGWKANPLVWVYEFERCEKPTEE